jgi:hypothetical protein
MTHVVLRMITDNFIAHQLRKRLLNAAQYLLLVVAIVGSAVSPGVYATPTLPVDGQYTFLGANCTAITSCVTSEGFFTLSAVNGRAGGSASVGADQYGAYLQDTNASSSGTSYLELKVTAGGSFKLLSAVVGEAVNSGPHVEKTEFFDVYVAGYANNILVAETPKHSSLTLFEADYNLDFSSFSGVSIDMIRVYFSWRSGLTAQSFFNFESLVLEGASNTPIASSVIPQQTTFFGTADYFSATSIAGVSGFTVPNIVGSGWDFTVFSNNNAVDATINVKPLTGQTHLAYGASNNGSTAITGIQLKPNARKLFDLKSVDVTIDNANGTNGSTSIPVRVTGYKDGGQVAGAALVLTVTNASGSGTLVAFDVSSNAAFIGIDSFRVTPTGSDITYAMGVDNIIAENFRDPPAANNSPNSDLFDFEIATGAISGAETNIFYQVNDNLSTHFGETVRLKVVADTTFLTNHEALNTPADGALSGDTSLWVDFMETKLWTVSLDNDFVFDLDSFKLHDDNSNGDVLVITTNKGGELVINSIGATNTLTYMIVSAATANDPTLFKGISSFTITSPVGSEYEDSFVIAVDDIAVSNVTVPSTSTAPTITSLNIISGSTAGGTVVTLTGTNLTGTASVTFGGVAGTALTVNSDTSITVTTPAGTAGAKDVVVTTPSGSVTSAGGYTYVVPAPTISSISPVSGSTAGNTSITITGADFTGATEVTFGGVAGTGLTINSDTSITVTTPAGSAGAKNVVVTTPGGSVTSTGGYTYVVPAPTISSISPSSGSTTGNTSITITGTNFTGATTVTFDGVAGTGLTINSGTSITVTTPAGTAGAKNVVVTTPGGSVTATGGYTYITAPAAAPIFDEAPAITNISTTRLDLSASLDKEGRFYYVVLPDGATAPTAAQVKAGTTSTGSPASHSGSAVISLSPFSHRFTISNLVSGTAYDIYVVAEDNASPTNVMALPVKLDATMSTLNALYFDNDATVTGLTGVSPAAFTVEFKLYIDSTVPASGYQRIYWRNGGTEEGIYLEADNRVSLWLNDGRDFASTTALRSNAWNHIAMTYSAATGFKIYINGVLNLESDQDLSGIDILPLVDLTIGDGLVDTALDDFRIWNVVRTPQEINNNKDAELVSPYPVSLVRYYDFNQGIGGADNTGVTALDDRTRNGASGTLSNFNLIGNESNWIESSSLLSSPFVASITPASGNVVGGDTVVITGEFLTGATAVTFGGVAATSFTVNSATQITAVVPAHAAGSVDVSVTTAGGAVISANLFAYGATPSAPSIGAVTAGDGQASVAFTAPTNNGGFAIIGYTVIASPGPITATGTTSPITVVGLTNGTDYTFTVTATNLLGTSLASGVSNAVKPNAAPVISGTPAPSVNEGEPYRFTPTASDIDTGDVLTFSATGLPSWLSISSVTGVVSGAPTNSDVGVSDSIVVSVSDGTASVSLTPFTITVVNVNDAPTITSSPVTTATQGEAYSYTLIAADEDVGDTATLSAVILPEWLTFNPATGVLGGTPGNADVGNHPVTLKVTDAGGLSVDQSFTVTVANVNDAPLISGTPLTSVDQDVAYSFTPTASDVDVGDVLTFSITNKPVWAAFNTATGVLSGTPAHEYAGTTTGIVISVSDGELNASLPAFNLEVIETIDPLQPVVTAPADIELNATGLYTPVNLRQLLSLNPSVTQEQVEAILNSMASDGVSGNTCCTTNPTGLNADNVLLLRPGRHEVVWNATNAADITGSATQVVMLNPLVSLSKPQVNVRGNTVSFRVLLNGPAPEYPWEVPYVIDSATTATTAEHNLVNGVARFTQAGQIDVAVPVTLAAVDGFSDSELVIALGDGINAGAANRHAISIRNGNVPPVVQLAVAQGGVHTNLITPTGGPITVTASVYDANAADTHSYDWSATTGLADTDGNPVDAIRVIDPAGLSGTRQVNLSVTDSAGASVSATAYFRVVATLPVLSPDTDTDGDGFDDTLEGIGDSDDNGIPDYLDNMPSPNILPQQIQSTTAYLIECDPGVRCGLGLFARGGISGGAQVLEDELATLEGITVDPAFEPVGGIFDFVIRDLPTPGQSVRIVIPQRSAIPANAVYRKYHNGHWVSFVEDADNALHSARGNPGYCPPPGNPDWTPGLTQGHFCLQLTIEDGGPNDDDGLENGAVVDPGAVSIALPVAPEPPLPEPPTPAKPPVNVKSSGGGAVDGVWILLLGSLLMLKLANTHRRKAVAAVALLVTSVTSQASDLNLNNAYVRVDVYKVEGGLTETQFSQSLSTAGHSFSVDRYDVNRRGYQLALGYQWHDYTYTEVGYLDLGDVNVDMTLAGDTNLAAFEYDLNKTYPVSAKGVTLVQGLTLFADQPVNVSLEGGVYVWRDDRKTNQQPINLKNDDGVAPLAGLRLDFTLTKSVSLGFNARRIYQDDQVVDLYSIATRFRF